MLVCCQAWEGMYQGLHGIETIEVIKVSDNIEEAKKEINEWGALESEDLIYTYGLEKEYLENLEDYGDEGYDEVYADITETSYYYDRGWRAWKVRDDIILSGEDPEEELDDIRYSIGLDSFIEKYCEKELDI